MKKIPKGPKLAGEYASEMDALMQGEVGRRKVFGGVNVPLKESKKVVKGGKKK